MAILVTGAAGFIGYHVAERLLAAGSAVVGLDNLNDYYDVQLKQDRLERLEAHPGFVFYRADLTDGDALEALFRRHGITHVVHLAAQAGVRYSLEQPQAYVASNVAGFVNVLEACRKANVAHLVYASSSSVYGANRKLPFSEQDPTNHPVSLYGATKKANELLAHTYSHNFGLPATGLRFFTVYGPWGRPDMAYFSFTRDILAGRPIRVYNHGDMRRDFTYIDDIAEAIVRLVPLAPGPNPAWDPVAPDPSSSAAPYRIYNIGHHTPVPLLDFIGTLERLLGREAKLELLPMQPGDVRETHADVSALEAAMGFRPATSIEEGLGKFVAWYRAYYGIES